MKKLVIASVVALASLNMVTAPNLRAQDQQSITIKDPAEYNAYQMANTQTDPKAKAAALETFLKTYPQSVVKAIALNDLVDIYWQLQDQENTLNAANRLLQVQPTDLKATLYSVIIKKGQCAKANGSDTQTCDDAAALAQKGLALTKPAATSDDEWQKLTHAAFPIFHSAIALDDVLSKKDYKGAQEQYTEELKLYSDQESKTQGLQDTLLLAKAYSQPGSTQDLVKACYYYARVWDFAPPAYKAQIEPSLEYYYKKYHGKLDGLDDVKTQAQAAALVPDSFKIAPAPSPAEMIHDLIAQTPDLNSLALADKETVLAMGSKDDADKMWAVLQGKETLVPGIVISATPDQIQMAVTQDAKDAKVADFIVNLKKPLTEAELKNIQPGFEFKAPPETALTGTYDTYKQVPATDKTSQSASIVLKDGEVVPAEKKKPAATHHPAHRPAHR